MADYNVEGRISDDEQDDENKPKDFRKALNTKATPTLKRITRSYENDNDFDLLSIHSTTTKTTVEGVPLYRELSNDTDLPKWRQNVYFVLPQPIRNSLKPPSTKEEWKKFIFIHLPIIQWIWNYIPKYLLGDIVAGLTIGVTHVPQSN